jgi:hypothetical protein
MTVSKVKQQTGDDASSVALLLLRACAYTLRRRLRSRR